MNREKLIRNPQDFKNECKTSAYFISQNTDLPISILLSGGLDSICVCESFRRENIPFTAYTLRFTNGANDFDISNAIKYCKKYNISQEIIELDLFDFWKSNLHIEYAKLCKTISPQFTVHCWLIDRVPGFILMGNGEVDLIKEDNELYHLSSEHQYYDERFMSEIHREGVVKFYNYTCEQEFSKYTDKCIFEWIKMENVTTDKGISHNKFYADTFGVEKRQLKRLRNSVYRSRYTGFEYVNDEDIKERERLKIMFPDWDYEWIRTPYLDFLDLFYDNSSWHNTLKNKIVKKYNDTKNNF